MLTNMLSEKDRLQTESGKKVQIVEFIGDGGQGEVYRCHYENSVEYALKWYFPSNSTHEQLEILKVLAKIGSPDHRFLWPIDIVRNLDNRECFGYIMPFRPSNYKSAIKLLDRSIEPSFHALLTACFQLSDSFLQLHSKGLSYKDISINNVFMEPQTGDILICDNDNCTYEGITYSGVGGTPSFMAPEIVRGEALPNKYTDLYSLSVLLFWFLYIAHPLDGAIEATIRAKDQAAFKKLYGTEPLYIFHPTDERNRPDPEFHSNTIAYHAVYPKNLRDIFERSFTIGVHEPKNQVEESVWRALFISLRDNIVVCSNCGAELFYDIDDVRNGRPTRCWSCQHETEVPARMKIGSNIVILNDNVKLYSHHTKGMLYDFSKSTAEISEHPALKHKGLKNLSDDIWYVTKSDQSVIQVAPGRSFALENGLTVKFGLVSGFIRK
jgi:serine/threonine protein kinase